MEKEKVIAPYDSNGKNHGYHEWYNVNGEIWYRGTYKHGLEIGYEEWFNVRATSFYIR